MSDTDTTPTISTAVEGSISDTDRAASASDRDVIESRGLDVHYGETQALQDVDLAIPERRVTAIIGPSGCGKSTYLRCINRMNDLVEAATIEGELLFDGTDVYGEDVDPVALRRRIGMVFQHPNPFPKSIYDNVAYGLRVQNRKVTDERVRTALERAALWEEVNDQLETSALDPIATSKIEDLIEELAEDYTVVIVTHNMQQAARISDRTAVFLTGGELVEYDDTQTIFENPAHDRVEDYITGKFG